MKRLIAIQFVLILIFLMGLNLTAWAHTNISPQDAKDLIDADNQLMVIDVREVTEYCGVNQHIPGALNYPWNSGVLEKNYTVLPMDAEILVVCASGSRSNQAASFLDTQGYLIVYDMLAGMSAWQWERVGCTDSDGDGVNDDLDNCPDDYNPNQADSNCNGIGNICDITTACTEDVDCDNDCDGVYNQNDNCPSSYNRLQLDTYPPQGNGIGDACDCESDFDCSGGVDANDVTDFLTDFGRSTFFNPCTNGNPCNGDVDCNVNVDANDVNKFLEDFGRSQFNNPCPACVAGSWCVYP